MRTHRWSLPLVCGLLACGSTEPSKPGANEPAERPAAPVEPVVKPPVEPAAKPAEAVTMAQSLNTFAVDLHRALAPEPGNIFVSPASVAFAFAMAHAGARGETARQIESTFHFGGDTTKLHAELAATLAGWTVDREGQKLAVANRLYGERTVRFEKTYLDLTRDVFAAPLELVDFNSNPDAARVRINTWVAERTQDKIKDLIPGGGLDNSVRLVVVNAVYFKATWAEPFKKSETRSEPFHAAAGDRPVDMMQRTGLYGHARVAGASVLELPYTGDLLSLVVVLPDARDGLAAIEQGMDAAQLAAWTEPLMRKRVAVKLPRFKIAPDRGILLRKLLSGLGMTDVFGGGADFTGIAPKEEGIYISDAIHKAFIAVDEEGTEAAAATALIAKGGGPPPPPEEFTADHPFLFFIRDVKTGAIVFMGRLVDPKPT